MKRIVLVASLALVIVPAVASAQIGLGISAGPARPMSDLSNNFDDGYGIQGSLSFSPVMVPAGFRIEGTYDHFGLKSSIAASTGSEDFTGMSANLLVGLGGPVAGPYMIAGVGYYQNKFTLNSTSTTQDNPGFNFGGGLKVGVGTLLASIEARYFFVNGSNGAPNSSFIPVTFGISF